MREKIFFIKHTSKNTLRNTPIEKNIDIRTQS